MALVVAGETGTRLPSVSETGLACCFLAFGAFVAFRAFAACCAFGVRPFAFLAAVDDSLSLDLRLGN